jgi:uncharacterized protein (DUF1697 family)
MKNHIALLRGVNVGGNRLVKMADLKAFLESLGLDEPLTLLQSGNAAFGSSLDSTALETLLERASLVRFGFSIEFFVRSSLELHGMIARNPFPLESESDPARLIAFLLKKEVFRTDVEALGERIKGPERIAGEGRELYVFYPDGQGSSKVSSTPGWSKLVGAGTGRNWNTILKLAQLLN